MYDRFMEEEGVCRKRSCVQMKWLNLVPIAERKGSNESTSWGGEFLWLLFFLGRVFTLFYSFLLSADWMCWCCYCWLWLLPPLLLMRVIYVLCLDDILLVVQWRISAKKYFINCILPTAQNNNNSFVKPDKCGKVNGLGGDAEASAWKRLRVQRDWFSENKSDSSIKI